VRRGRQRKFPCSWPLRNIQAALHGNLCNTAIQPGARELVAFTAAIVLLAAMLLFDRQFEEYRAAQAVAPGTFATTAVWLVIALTALNVVSTLLECGFGACADNPLVYELLKH
jgi:hypothetical protein